MPSWNGDFRIDDQPDEGGPRTAPGPATRSVLRVHAPTLAETKVLQEFLKRAHKQGWVADATLPEGDAEVPLSVPAATAAPVLVQLAKPADRTITAVRFENGQLRVTEDARSAVLAPPPPPTPTPTPAPTPKPVSAVSVARPTPCCPLCVPGSIGPAREVLLEFLTPAQHAQWARDRAILVRGGTSGHRYVLAHRGTERARRQTKICFDLDDGVVIHFYDWSVPPEEEVLGAKLILEHREAWLRNEATCAGSFGARDVYKNPFGDVADGTADSGFLLGIGLALQAYGFGERAS